ncbi:response regulator [Paenibacillus sp. HWE-109]|uniref:response regulator n=1 Tax=Paenibacillus sp. HWE-109 TaxID=1306526 RepID=UPI001EDDA89D|nr:response regulator [Paenibacillus sp. HWE-109]UKS25460.1 response regulator [Paenibacillus sp. HWE-109]
MKLIIADDESLIRASILSMVQDVETSWQLAGEASNGEELLDLVKEHRPNVAIIDIRMPRMSGLEAMQLGRVISPCTKWIILSGYSDFAYAQEAMKLGASEYLLKPVNPVELERALANTAKDNKEFIRMLNQQFENSSFALCNGLTSMKFEELDSIFVQGWFIGAICLFDTTCTGKALSDITSRFYDDLRGCMHSQLVYGMNFAMISLLSGDLAVIGSWDPAKGLASKEQVHHFFDALADRAGNSLQGAAAITILQTAECHGFDALNQQLGQLGLWNSLRAVCGVGRRLAYAELQTEAGDDLKVRASHLLCSIKHHLQIRGYLNYLSAVSEMEGVWPQAAWLNQDTYRCAVQLFMQHALGIAAAAPLTQEEMMKELRSLGESRLLEIKPREPVTADLIEQVVHYLEQHYMEDVGIGQIAHQLNVSANYLSTLFHKKTGTPFVKYLTNIRMLKAKELLLNTNLQVKQIAEKVGYYSTRHFTKLFVENCLSYPSDYRKSQA